ncbi:coiled-coil domain-containing protein MTMR15 [Ophiocordyceps camponoti-floridani]|uniref:Fanconi-associated nuclease n=1 Tax=Ophiocordyceps camponoti-floridani TaxID=2030778 RepID=A0A8H4Q6S5_9HYPO|nr:coiled-coil domain-containing protein MTMR15 [Ophiocordyceps camponoti-floridani]
MDKDDKGRLENMERPCKRLKQGNSPDLGDDSSGDSEAEAGTQHRRQGARITDVENVLPPTQTDDEAVKSYELIKSQQTDGNQDTSQSGWVRGKSSIYVDAFNLALDTVLEQESELFDEREKEVFQQWRGLDYESQYLYVRLFLRKTWAWHRCSRLRYHSDVSDLDGAIVSLQKPRDLPDIDSVSELPDLDVEPFRLGESFTFADASEDQVKTMEEAAPLLYLDELKALAKEAKVQGRNKAELIQGLCRAGQQQTGLTAVGLVRHNSRDSSTSIKAQAKPLAKLRREDSNREQHFLGKMLAVTGRCIRLSSTTQKLFERVHLVFYRSTQWTDKSLTTVILAKMARRNFPEYIVCRTMTIFASRTHLLEYEAAIRLEAEVDGILEGSGTPTEADMQRIVDVSERIYPRWRALVAEEDDKERRVYEMGEGAYLRRFNPAHSYTRILHKSLWVTGRRKQHVKEHSILTELLEQKLFHPARRGSWYQRKALIEEHYMATGQDEGKKWKRAAAATCEAGLQDPDCHLIYHDDLQKRLVKLEKKLRIPRRLQHDFGHVRLAEPMEMTVEGVQLKRKEGSSSSRRTMWLDEQQQDEMKWCSVEDMCLSQLRRQGWKGYHAEGGVIRTLFAYLMHDILFSYMPNVFQTAYQTCPLDLHTDSFFPARCSAINRRLAEIANGEGEKLLRRVWRREHVRRPLVAGLDWDFDVDDLAELVACFGGGPLAAVCKLLAQEYRQRGGDTQRLWIHALTAAGVKVALCNAVAREVRQL